ncbi:MAG: molybdopterin molybdotransferase MoeA [Candidatus Omnitrophica bacterium]|nr:molybdopterin molybdotransferase MoeA [Candidatus Omnitrophota bacterium]
MISVYQAEHIVLNSVKSAPIEIVPLSQANGRLLREPIRSDRDQPSFDKALMDGIAIHSSSYEKGVREFPIEKTVAAGDKPYKLKNPAYCVEIMTGAVLPSGCNAVIPMEQVGIEGDNASLKGWTLVKPRQNISFKGADSKKGQMLIKDPCRLLTPHISILASVGKTKVKVSSIPNIAIISTGDELVEIDKQPKDYQTRLSNSHTLKSLIEGSGLAKGTIFHYPDDKKRLLKGVGQNLKDFDMLILSGGVSMGQFDYVPEVLKELGIKELFHKVAQKPGKPFWFGNSRTGKAVFALPGNPVSTQICAYRFVIPFLKKTAGIKVTQELVQLSQVPQKPGDNTEFIPVKISEKNGTRFAQPIQIGGSGDFAALADADGFIEYDQNQKSLWPYFSWRV